MRAIMPRIMSSIAHIRTLTVLLISCLPCGTRPTILRPLAACDANTAVSVFGRHHLHLWGDRDAVADPPSMLPEEVAHLQRPPSCRLPAPYDGLAVAHDGSRKAANRERRA